MAVQEQISANRLRAKVGKTLDVLVDAVAEGRAIGRSTADAPEIDGVVRVEDGGALYAGSFARILVTAASEHDLVGRLAAA